MAHVRSGCLAFGLLIAQSISLHAVPPPPTTTTEAMRIVAVVNGDVISNSDVDSRTRLFALSTGLPMTPDVLDRLKHQITRQLIDEKLRMQEVQRRKIVVPDKAIADAMHEIESRNGMPAGDAPPETRCGWRRSADLGRPVAHTARLDSGAARAAWRPGEDHGRRGGRASSVCSRSRSENLNFALARSSYRLTIRPPPTTRSALLRRSSASCAPVHRFPWLLRSSARIRPRCRVARLAGSSQISLIPRWHTWFPKCRSVRSAIR